MTGRSRGRPSNPPGPVVCCGVLGCTATNRATTKQSNIYPMPSAEPLRGSWISAINAYNQCRVAAGHGRGQQGFVNREVHYVCAQHFGEEHLLPNGYLRGTAVPNKFPPLPQGLVATTPPGARGPRPLQTPFLRNPLSVRMLQRSGSPRRGMLPGQRQYLHPRSYIGGARPGAQFAGGVQGRLPCAFCGYIAPDRAALHLHDSQAHLHEHKRVAGEATYSKEYAIPGEPCDDCKFSESFLEELKKNKEEMTKVFQEFETENEKMKASIADLLDESKVMNFSNYVREECTSSSSSE